MVRKIIITTLYIITTLSAWGEYPSQEEMMELFSQNIKSAHVTFSATSINKTEQKETSNKAYKDCQASFYFYLGMALDSVHYRSIVSVINEKFAPDGAIMHRTAKKNNSYSSTRRVGDTLFVIEGRNNITKIFDEEGYEKESYTTNRFGATTNRTHREKLPYGESEVTSLHLSMEGDTTAIEKTHYNAQGDITIRSFISRDKERQDEERYSYDSQGNLLQIISRQTELEITESFEYNSQNKKSNHYTWRWNRFKQEAPSLTMEEHYSYDKKGNLSRYTKEENGEKNSFVNIRYAYDTEGRMIDREEMDKAGKTKAHYLLKKNETGTFTAYEEREETTETIAYKLHTTTLLDQWGNVVRKETRNVSDLYESTEIISVDYEYYQP